MKLMERISAELANRNWIANGKCFIKILDNARIATIGSREVYVPAEEGIYLKVEDAETCLGPYEFEEDEKVDDVLFFIEDLFNDILGVDDESMRKSVDKLTEAAKTKGVYNDHKNRYETTPLEEYGEDIIIPFIKENSLHASTLMAKAYVDRIADRHWVEDILNAGAASLKDKVDYIETFLWKLDNVPEAVQETWCSLVEEIGL